MHLAGFSGTRLLAYDAACRARCTCTCARRVVSGSATTCCSATTFGLTRLAYRDAKAHLQDLLVERAAAAARREKFDASEVRTLFRNAAPTMRVLALGLMQGDPSLADGPTIVDAIANSRSANEQYQGLRLTEQCWPRLTPSFREAVRAAIEASPEIKTGESRRALAEKILSLPKS